MSRVVSRFASLGVLALAALALTSVSCGASGESFQPGFREYREPGFSAFVAEIQRSAPREERPVVAMITAATPPHIAVWDLAAGRMLWDREVHDVTAAPIVAGDAVVTQEATRIVLRNLATGDELATIQTEDEKLVGADGVHDLVAVALRQGPDLTAHGRLVMLRGGSQLWDHEVQLSLGVPAVVGRFVIAPWGTQQVTVIDAATGREETRLRIRDDVVGQVLADRGSVYFGQYGIFRITPSVQTASKHHAAYYAPRGRPLPGQPPLLRDGYEAAPAPDSARHRLRLAWRPAGEGETITLQDDTLYFVFYSELFALAPDEDAVRWVYVRPVDLVGVQAQPGGLLAADASGKLTFVTAQEGRATWEVDTGAGRLDAACVRAGTFVPPAPATTGEPQPSATERLFAAASVDDARLGGGRALAAQYMARDDGATVTGHLVTLCAAAASPAPVRTAACDALAVRTSGDSFVLDALAQRASFLDATPAPPVGALSRAAAKMNLHRAVPDLVAHLADPATSSVDLPPLLEALASLHAVSASRPVEDFLRLYHADPDDAHTVEALGVAAETLIALRGHAEDALLHRIADDATTPQALRDRLTRDLTQGVPQPAAPTPPTTPTPPTPPAHPTPPPPAAEPDARPEQLSGALIAATLHPIERQLRHCLEEAEPPPASARALVVVTAAGEVTSVSVSPPSVAPCVEHQLRSRRFPETRLGHAQQVTWVIRRDAPPAPPPAAPDAGAARPHGRPAPADGGVAVPRPRARPEADGGVPAPRPRPHVDAGAH